VISEGKKKRTSQRKLKYNEITAIIYNNDTIATI